MLMQVDKDHSPQWLSRQYFFYFAFSRANTWLPTCFPKYPGSQGYIRD
jgi:hypothetical protein